MSPTTAINSLSDTPKDRHRERPRPPAMTWPNHCPSCDDFGRVETKYGLLVCPEPAHRFEKSLCPWDGPTPGEWLEEYCRLRDSLERLIRAREQWGN